MQCRPAVCTQCQRYSTLRSYDTQKWLGLGAIPILPLGTVRVEGECPVCGHRQGEATAKPAAVSIASIEELKAQFALDPENARVGRDLHYALFEEGEYAEAEAVARILLERFPNDPETLAYLGDAARELDQLDEAIRLYEQAYRIDPACRTALAGQAWVYWRTGKFEEARALLPELEGGTAEDPEPFLELAHDLRRSGRHAEALDVYHYVLYSMGTYDSDKDFRKAVQESEKAAGRTTSMLSPVRWYSRPIGRLLLVLLVVGGGIFGSNYYYKQNQRLFIVNGYPVDCALKIAGGEFTLPAGTQLEIGLPEGEYVAEVVSPRPESIPVKMQTPFWKRWTAVPGYVVNPGGAALLVSQSVAYAADGRQVKNTGTQTLHLGERMVSLPQLDHPFEQFPEQIDDFRPMGKFKFRIDFVGNPPEEIFEALRQRGKPQDALNLAEWQLQLYPENPWLLAGYFNLAIQLREQDRAHGLLTNMLARRPVLMKWHRFHQDLAQRNGMRDEVVQEYDAYVQLNPEDAAAQYLRGRLATGVAEARPYYLRAAALATNYAYAQFALGYCAVARGDWEEARPRFEAACRLDPQTEEFFEARFKARLAVRDFEALQQELEPMLKDDPTDYIAALALYQVWLERGDAEQAKLVLERFRAAAPPQLKGTPDPEGRLLIANFLYAQGDFERILTSVTNRSAVRYHAIVELGRSDELIEMVRPEANRMLPDALLLAAVALRSQGRAAEAQEFWDLAVKKFQTGMPDHRRVAELLSQETPPDLETVKDVLLSLPEKLSLALALAQKHPANRAAYAEFARRLNVTRTFPYHLANRLTASGG